MAVYTQMDETAAEEVVQHINIDNAIVEIYSRQDLTRLAGKAFKDLAIIKPNLMRILMVNNNLENVIQKENVIKTTSFFGINNEDNCLKILAELIEKEMENVDLPEDLRIICGRINTATVAQINNIKKIC